MEGNRTILRRLALAWLAILFAWSAAAQPVAPQLKIVETPGNVTVSWPLTGYYLILESATNLSPASVWENRVTASRDVYSIGWQPGGVVSLTTNIVGDEAQVTLAATNAQEVFRLKGGAVIPAFQFAALYSGLLEFSTSPAMTINGPVHANGPIYTGTSTSLTFNDTVTTASTISSPPNNGQGPVWSDTGTYNGAPPTATNVSPLLLRSIGTNNARVLIEMPPAGEDPTSALGRTRLYNQAHVVLLVSNTWVTIRVQDGGAGLPPGADPSPIVLKYTNNVATINTLLFLNLTNVFRDSRESKNALATQINVGRYALWLLTNTAVQSKFPAVMGTSPVIHYVADYRTVAANEMTVVRLTNGLAPPKRGGFTLVTPNPLYVWGNYNCTNSAELGTTNTTSTVPCALMSDALTILSSSWKDANSLGTTFSTSSVNWDASLVTTVNAAILTGVVPSTGSGSTEFSGGIQNLPRLLEDWNGCNLWLNTSLVSLYDSARATNQFQNPSIYFRPPVRHFNFDSKFSSPSYLPPGTPLVTVSAPAN